MGKKKVIYIAGPYRAKTINEVYNNIAEARRRAEWAWANGYIPICPHLNSAFMDGIVPDEIILNSYLQLLELCDVILMITGWEKSDGSRAELRRAQRLSLKVIADPIIALPEAIFFGDYIKQINGSGKKEDVDVNDPLRYK